MAPWRLISWLRVGFLLVAACAAAPAHPVSVAVLVDGDRSAVGALGPTAVNGLELVPIELPAPAPLAGDDTSAQLARARAAYARGDHAVCRGELAKVDVAKLLARADRALAARALTLEAACAYQALAKEDARAAAARLAGLGLELPETSVAPDAEQLIGDAIVAAGKAARSPLAIRGAIGARLTVDGRPGGCAVPCTVDLPPGDHVIALDADGFAPAWQVVRTPDTRDVAIAQQVAPRELAAKQWRDRLGRGLAPTDATGVALLARIAMVPRVAFVHGGAQLTGALVVDGALRARGERAPGESPQLVRELAYDAGVLRRPALWRRPAFWIATSAATLIVSSVVIVTMYQPETKTMVHF
jgi:PEGA domain-containing protein